MVRDLFHAFFSVLFWFKVIIDGEEGELREMSFGGLPVLPVLPVRTLGITKDLRPKIVKVMPGMKNGWVWSNYSDLTRPHPK